MSQSRRNTVKRQLVVRENQGDFQPVSKKDHYRQYVNCWGIDKTFYFDSENYMENVFDMPSFGRDARGIYTASSGYLSKIKKPELRQKLR